MKFSYPLIKKLLPRLKDKRELIDALTMHAFEAEDASGNTFEVSLPPNRYSDAGSHWGIAREVAAILGLKKVNIPARSLNARESDFAKLQVKILDKVSCSRYSAQCFENVSIGDSPIWMRRVLEDCGIRPINNVVDIMNYVMLETGQPLHAFDYDKIEGKRGSAKVLMVRRAKKGDSMISLDKTRYQLTPEMLVITDIKRPLAIAGVKGGVPAEITLKTKRIVVESANFNAPDIYRTSRALNLRTDASQRFSHELSPHLTTIALERAAQLLIEITEARAGLHVDVLSKSLPRTTIRVSLKDINRVIGVDIERGQIVDILERLGFKVKETLGKNKERLFECVAPLLRTDITEAGDVIEEIVRLYGFQKIKPLPPSVLIKAPEFEKIFGVMDAARNFLRGAGYDEVYNYSMVDREAATRLSSEELGPELENPISNEFSHLRNSLLPGLLKNIEHNRKFFDEVKVFEIGHTFSLKKRKKSEEVEEKTILGFAAASPRESFFEIKGIAKTFLEDLGAREITFKEIKKNNWSLGVWNSGEFLGIIAQIDKVGLAELDLEHIASLSSKEAHYEPIPKFPGVMRDVSFLISRGRKIGFIINEIFLLNKNLVRGVDLIDEYSGDKWPGLQSLTLRIIFQAPDRTLTAEEVDKEMKRIGDLLKHKFKAQIR